MTQSMNYSITQSINELLNHSINQWRPCCCFVPTECCACCCLLATSSSSNEESKHSFFQFACLLVCLSWNMIDCGARLPINQSINEPTTRAFLALLNLKDFERKEQVRPDSSFLLRLNRNNVATGSICCHGRMASTYNRHRKGSTDPTKTNNCRLSPLGFLIHFYALSRQSTTHAKKRSW